MTRPGRATRIVRGARFTRRGTTLVVVGVACILAAYALERPELLYVGALTVALPLLAVAFARFRRVSLAVTRTFSPNIVAVGQPTTVELTVTNTAPLPSSEVTWRDFRPWSTGQNEAMPLQSLAARRGRAVLPGNSTRMRYELTAPRRGLFPIGPLSVVLADPFGLATGEVAVGGTDTLVVTPSLSPLPDTGLAIVASDGESTIVRRAIGGNDDLSTREYRTGDAMRRVHWRATARHGELMVRQEEPRSHAEARIVLDTRRGGYGQTRRHHRDEPESESFELAIALAGSIALHLAHSGFRVELIETGHLQLNPVAPIGPFLETLATIELSLASGEYAAESTMSTASRPDRAHGSVFAIVSEADAATIERLILQRPTFDLAIAFVISPPGSTSLELLTDAGWICARVDPGDTVEHAWRAVAGDQEIRYGR